MPDHWNVLPVSPEITSWLSEAGQPPHLGITRFPTLDELLAVLASFHLPVSVEQLNDGTAGISLGDSNSLETVYILGDPKDGVIEFQFEGRNCSQRLMLATLKKLCQTCCQELVIYESTSAIPCLVDANTDVDEALIAWQIKLDEYAAGKLP